MLHVILLILKFIGWIVLVILGLIVLLIFAVLFTPLRYQIQANCRGTLATLDAGVSFSAFFHLVSGNVRYTEEKLVWNLRIAWKRLGSETLEEKEISVTEEKTPDKVEALPSETETQKKPETTQPSETEAVEKTEITVTEAEAPKKPETTQQSETETPKKPETTQPSEAEIQKKPETQPSEAETTKKTEPRSIGTEQKSKAFLDKMKGIFYKIKYTFQKFCDKMRLLLKKKEVLMTFIKEESHKAAFYKALVELKKLILRLKPKKLSADIRFGFEDPCLTGQVLAAASMLYPIADGNVDICPDFENKVLEGQLFIKGHVRARIFAALLLNMILNKDVRKTIIDIKNFSFDV